VRQENCLIAIRLTFQYESQTNSHETFKFPSPASVFLRLKQPACAGERTFQITEKSRRSFRSVGTDYREGANDPSLVGFGIFARRPS
jgi:hypothetical protein